MKTALQVASGISMIVSVCEIWHGRIDGAILFLVWAFYLKYNSDQRD